MTGTVRGATLPTGSAGADTTAPGPQPAPSTISGSRRSWHLRANAVVLAYVGLSVLSVVLHDWPAVPMPRWLAVHLLLLGAVTNAIVTWSEHFAVALLRARQPSRRAAAIRLASLNLAIIGILVGVGAALAWLTVASATLLAGVVLAHLGSLRTIARRALTGRFAGTVTFYLAGGAAVIVGITLGTLVAVNAVSHRWHEPLHAAHVHANIFGWVGLTVLGTLFTLWPTVLRTRIADQVTRSAARCLALTTAGLTISVTGLAADLRWVGVGGLAIYGAGVLFALQPFAANWRRKSPRDLAAWSMAAGTGWLALAVLSDLVLLASAPDLASYLPRLDALVPAVVVGFVLQTLLGALTYLLPVVWGGGPAGVRASIDRLSPWWRARLGALNTGALLVAGSGFLSVPAVVPAVGWTLVVTPVALFLGLVLGALVPPAARSALTGPARRGVTLGLVMTLVPVAVALSGQSAPGGAESISLHGSGGARDVAVSLVSMDIRPGVIEVPAGTRLRLVVTNHDTMRHDLAFPAGPGTPLLARGASATLDLGTVKANRSGWCTVPGHRAAGMTLEIHVTGSGAAVAGSGTGSAAAAGGHQEMPGMTGGTTPGPDVHGAPGSGWAPYKAAAAPAPLATVHRVTLRVVEREAEVAPGVRQRIWTFGGTAPGPVLRGRVGDLFEVTLVNAGTMAHGIDFHAGQGAPDQEMRSLEPGESLVYRFRADHSGAWLYHCSTMAMTAHIANGMYGAVIIDPPGLPAVDREYVLVASQGYPGTRSSGADAGALRRGDWSFAAFNGYPDQYVHTPLTSRVGERVRWWVVAAGPGEGVAFHIVGAQFDTVFKEGAYLLRRGNPEHGASQVLDLAAAQGGFVEQVFTEPGHYSLIDHDMRRGENGARGVVAVTR